MSRRLLATPWFLALQVALAAALGVLFLWREAELQGERALPPLRPEPLSVAPLYDDPAVVSDADLERVLSRLGISRQLAVSDFGHLDHALRLWGKDARFQERMLVDSAEMLRIFLDHRAFAGIFGSSFPPLLVDDGSRVTIRTLEGPLSAVHTDHLLATLGEIGMPLETPVTTPLRTVTLRALLEGSLAEFRLNQREYEWSALAYALYLPPANRWVTTEGQEVTFDRLAERIMRARLPEGVCSAHHRLHALVVFLRVDEQMREAGEAPLLGPEARARIERYLAGVTATLVRNQHSRGFWNGNWPTQAPPAEEITGAEGDTLADRLIVTGHALEWWALAPEGLLPPRPVVSRAAAWLVGRAAGFSDEEIRENFSYLTHVGRALALWRGREAAPGGPGSSPAGS